MKELKCGFFDSGMEIWFIIHRDRLVQIIDSMRNVIRNIHNFSRRLNSFNYCFAIEFSTPDLWQHMLKPKHISLIGIPLVDFSRTVMSVSHKIGALFIASQLGYPLINICWKDYPPFMPYKQYIDRICIQWVNMHMCSCI